MLSILASDTPLVKSSLTQTMAFREQAFAQRNYTPSGSVESPRALTTSRKWMINGGGSTRFVDRKNRLEAKWHMGTEGVKRGGHPRLLRSVSSTPDRQVDSYKIAC